MGITVETWFTDSLYSILYAKLRKRFFPRALGKDTIHRIVKQNLTVLNARDYYFLRLYATYGTNVHTVAKSAETSYKRARRAVDIAIRKMMSPECLVNAKAIPAFKHDGEPLRTSRVLRTNTVKRLAQSGIETDKDLLFWFKLGPEYLFRIPEVAENRIIEILSHLTDKKMI